MSGTDRGQEDRMRDRSEAIRQAKALVAQMTLEENWRKRRLS